jgi:hypothetical protein
MALAVRYGKVWQNIFVRIDAEMDTDGDWSLPRPKILSGNF